MKVKGVKIKMVRLVPEGSDVHVTLYTKEGKRRVPAFYAKLPQTDLKKELDDFIAQVPVEQEKFAQLWPASERSIPPDYSQEELPF